MDTNSPERLLQALIVLEKNLPTYQAAVGATAAELTMIGHDRANLAQALANQDIIAVDGKAATGIKNSVYDAPSDVNIAGYPPFSITPLPFPNVVGGCLGRYQMLKAHLKSSAGYTRDIGIALGFEEAESVAPELDTLIGAAILQDLGNYQYQATFKKAGATGMQFQERIKGTEKWFDSKTAIVSPIVITVAAPTSEGAAVQIEVRCRPMKGNDLIGQWSPIYPLTVNS